METWEKICLFVTLIFAFGVLDRTLNHIIELLREIRDRLPPE